MMKQLRSSAKTFTEISSEAKRSVWLSSKPRIMSKSSITVQDAAVGTLAEKFTRKIVVG